MIVGSDLHRYDGVMGSGNANARTDCPFCLGHTEVCASNEHAIAIRDGFPVSPGHTLVIPKQHAASLFDLPLDVQESIWKLVAVVRDRLMAEFHPDGFNVGLNDGRAAGQTIMHAHVHVIPRFNGDLADPRGGVRWVIPGKAAYWKKEC